MAKSNQINDPTASCIATPNYAGFVPNLKHQYGLTYGNATRHILRIDPTINCGVIQQEMAKKVLSENARTAQSPSSGRDIPQSINDRWVWQTGKKYATGDDRFSFPPVPGYTGFIPRSQEHFGRSYVETTSESLADFHEMLNTKASLPPRIKAIQQAQRTKPLKVSGSKPHPKSLAAHHVAGGGFAGGNASGASAFAPVPPPETTQKKRLSAARPTFTYSAASTSSPIDDMSPYRLPQGHPQKTFIGGYTGFVPRLQNHFGEPYPDNVREALDEFTAAKPNADPYTNLKSGAQAPVVVSKKVNVGVSRPIPGFTGFIPGSRSHYSATFGKTAELAYEQFNNKREQSGKTNEPTVNLPPKDLAQSRPIPGYRGHIPKYIFSGDRPYGISTKACIDDFDRERRTYKKEMAERNRILGIQVAGV